jgi:hypothetical protein
VPCTNPSKTNPYVDETSKRPFLEQNCLNVSVAWKRIGAFRLGFLALMVSAELTFAAQASPKDQQGEYDQLMEAGYKLLQQGEEKRSAGELARHAGNFDQALPLYDKAVELDEQALGLFRSAENYAREDRRKHAVFFEGVAFNEKGNAIVVYNRATENLKRGAPGAFCSAVHEIERSMALGMTPEVNPSLWFELGRALMGTGEYKEGMRVLQLFDSPQGNPAQQKQTQIAQELIKSAKEAIKTAETITPPKPCGKALLPIKAPTKDDKPAPLAEQTESQIVWSITTGLGYDGNVTHLGRGLPVPDGLAGKGAAFNETTLSVEGDWFLHHKEGKDDLVDKLAANYAIIHDTYEDHSGSNSLGQTGFISYCHAMNKNLCTGFQIADTWLRDDKQNLSNTLAPQANLRYQESDRLAGKISYTLSWNKYFTPTTALTTSMDLPIEYS